MKKVLLVLSVVALFTINCFSQIGEVLQVEKFELVGKTSNPYKWVKLEKSKDAYLITFLNLEYNIITDIGTVSFEATPDELTYLYNIFIDMCNSEKKTQRILTLGTASVMITTQASKQIRLDVKEEGKPNKWTWLSKKQLSKVFRK